MEQQWLAPMNMLVAVVAVSLILLVTRLRPKADSVGAGLISITTLSNKLTTIVMAYTGLETSLGAISKLMRFDEMTELEHQGARRESYTPELACPARGRVQMANVEASYDAEGGAKVLREICLVVEAREKLAIRGHAGSRKSPVLALLLRLIGPITTASDPPIDPIVIDGLLMATVDHATLRERIIAVAQVLVFLPRGTAWRLNLAPWAVASEAECLAALRAVHPILPLLPLTTTTAATAGCVDHEEEPNGLDGPLEEARLSGGQRQLLAFRAGGPAAAREAPGDGARWQPASRRDYVERRCQGRGGCAASAGERVRCIYCHHGHASGGGGGAMAAACGCVVVMDSGRVPQAERPRLSSLRSRSRGDVSRIRRLTGVDVGYRTCIHVKVVRGSTWGLYHI